MDRATSVKCTDYEILVGLRLLEEIPKDVVASHPSTSYVIITDENVAKLYGETLRQGLQDAAGTSSGVVMYTIQPGCSVLLALALESHPT